MSTGEHTKYLQKLAQKCRLSSTATQKLVSLAPRLKVGDTFQLHVAQLLAMIDKAPVTNKHVLMDKVVAKGTLSTKETLLIQLSVIAKQINLDRDSRGVLAASIRSGEIKTPERLLRCFGGDLPRAKAALASRGPEVRNNGSSPGAGGAGSIEAINRTKEFFWVEIDAQGKEVSARSARCDDVDRMGNTVSKELARKRHSFIQVSRSTNEWWPVAGWLCEHRDQLKRLQQSVRFR